MLAIAFIQPAFAASAFSPTKIAKITLHDSGDLIVVFKSAVIVEGCKNTWAVVLQRSNPFFKERYAALLSAFHGQTLVSGYVNGCSTEWQSKDLAYLIRIDLEK